MKKAYGILAAIALIIAFIVSETSPAAALISMLVHMFLMHKAGIVNYLEEIEKDY